MTRAPSATTAARPTSSRMGTRTGIARSRSPALRRSAGGRSRTTTNALSQGAGDGVVEAAAEAEEVAAGVFTVGAVGQQDRREVERGRDQEGGAGKAGVAVRIGREEVSGRQHPV